MTLKAKRQFGTTIINPANGAVLMRFDVNLQEKYLGSSDITTHPIEDGEAITSNAHPRQPMYELTGLITNTPLVLEVGVQNRVEFYFNVLERLMASGQRLTVVSGLKVYETALISDYSLPRSAADGQSVSISLKIVQIQVVSSATVRVPASILRSIRRSSGKSKPKSGAGGKEPTNKQKKPVEDKSFLFFINESLGG